MRVQRRLPPEAGASPVRMASTMARRFRSIWRSHNLERILKVTDLPVTIDMEAGYGDGPDEVEASVARAAEAGAVGINIEDKDPVTRTVVRHRRCSGADQGGGATAAFGSMPAPICSSSRRKMQHDAALVDAVIERAKAYADAGANSLFVPFVYDAA